jgi:hypothetical protein
MTQAKHTDEDLLLPLDLAPRPPALPPEMWTLADIEARTHRPVFCPPPQRPMKPVKRPVQVPGWLTIAVVLCALYAAVRHQGIDITCSLNDDAVQCRMVNRPAPWLQSSLSEVSA